MYRAINTNSQENDINLCIVDNLNKVCHIILQVILIQYFIVLKFKPVIYVNSESESNSLFNWCFSSNRNKEIKIKNSHGVQIGSISQMLI